MINAITPKIVLETHVGGRAEFLTAGTFLANTVPVMIELIVEWCLALWTLLLHTLVFILTLAETLFTSIICEDASSSNSIKYF